MRPKQCQTQKRRFRDGQREDKLGWLAEMKQIHPENCTNTSLPRSSTQLFNTTTSWKQNARNPHEQVMTHFLTLKAYLFTNSGNIGTPATNDRTNVLQRTNNEKGLSFVHLHRSLA
jgi:hypothetical protein